MSTTTIEEVQAAVKGQVRVILCGGGSKPALSKAHKGEAALDLTGLSGILEYNPGEYTFTARAETRLADIVAALAEHGQYLPFDPPFVEQGATLAGTVAAGLSGPGRYRYGGVRDFILGVKLVDGRGEVVRGGGKVVKNAAGFDIPKLMVGSLGMLGAMVELSFKVFPKPPASCTIVHSIATMAESLTCLNRLYSSRLDIDALDFVPEAGGLKFFVRLRGLPDALPARAERLKTLIGGGEIHDESTEATWWPQIGAPAETALVKVPMTASKIRALEDYFAGRQTTQRRYSSGGNLVWLHTSETLESLHAALEGMKLAGLVIRGETDQIRIGWRTGQVFEQRIKQVLDPVNRFPSY